MKLGDLTELAARNLRESVLRNSLTTLGISVGVASLVALLSLGVGLQQLVDHSVARAGLFDTVSVRSRQSTPFGQPGGGPRNRDAANVTPPRPLDEAARKEIAALPNVLEVDPEIRFTAEARRDPNSQLVMVAGMAESSQSSGTLDGLNGRFFAGPDAEEAIIQGDLAKRLANAGDAPASLLGKEISLRFAQRQALPPASEQAPTDAPNQAVGPDEEAMGFSIVPSEKKFIVVGVTPTSDSGTGQVGFNNAGIYLPLSVAEKLQVVQQGDLRDVARTSAAQGPRYAALNIRASSPTAVAQIESSVIHMGFAAFSLIDVTRNLRTFFAIFDMFLGIFGSLALAVASLGIINTLVMAILERAAAKSGYSKRWAPQIAMCANCFLPRRE